MTVPICGHCCDCHRIHTQPIPSQIISPPTHPYLITSLGIARHMHWQYLAQLMLRGMGEDRKARDKAGVTDAMVLAAAIP